MRIKLSLIIAILLFGQPTAAFACSCRGTTVDQRIAHSSVIFSGTVTEVTGSSGGHCGPKNATVKVNQVWKGELPSVIEMPMSDGCVGCGMYLSNGVTYLVYGTKIDGTVRTSACSGSQPIQHIADDLGRLDEYQKKVSALNSTIDAAPQQITPLLAKADFLLQMKDFTGAAPVLQKAVTLPEAEKRSDVWQMLGICLEGIKQTDEAVVAYEKALKIAPDDAETQGLLQKLQLKGNSAAKQSLNASKDGRNLKFTDEEVREINFDGMDLRGVDFSKAKLTKVSFKNANLEGANFSYAEIYLADFTQANLSQVTPKDTRFYRVTMDGTKIKDTDFSTAEFIETTFRNMPMTAELFKAKIQGGGISSDKSSLWENVEIKETDLSKRHFDPIMLRNVTFSKVNLYWTFFSHSTFRDVTFEDSNFEKLYGQYSDLKGTVFKNTSLKQADLHQSHLDDTQFIETDLTETNFFASSLKGAKFRNVSVTPNISSVGAGEHHNRGTSNGSEPGFQGKTNFYMSVYDCKTVWPEGFDPSRAGAVLVDKACSSNLIPLDLHGGTIGTFNFGFGEDKKGPARTYDFTNGIFRNANMQNMILRGIVLDGADLTNAELSGTELTQSSLLGADFTGAKLDNVKLGLSTYDCRTKWPDDFNPASAGAISNDAACGEGADLRGTSFNRAKRGGAQLQGANMEGVDFTFAELNEADLSRANLQWANVNHASFGNAKLEKTNFSDAKLTGSRFDSGSSLKDAILTNTVMDRVVLRGVDMRGTDHNGRFMQAATLTDVNFENVSFERAKLDESKFHGANLNGANFKSASLNKAEFQWPRYSHLSVNFGASTKRNNYDRHEPNTATIGKADFQDADLASSYLGDADFSQADLEGADLSLAMFSCGAQWPEGYAPTEHGAILEESCENRSFPPTNLSRRNLAGKWIAFANLKNANLEGADFSGATLHDVVLTGANLKNAKFLLARYSCDQTIWPDKFDPGKHRAIPVGGKCKDKPYSLPSLAGADLKQANLSNLSLVNMNFSRADLKLSTFERSDLSKANLSEAKLQGAKFYGVNLHETNLKAAEYDCATSWPHGFDPSAAGAINIEGDCGKDKNQTNREMIRGLMISPPLEIHAEGSDFSDKSFVGTNFKNVSLGGANFSGSKLDWAEISMGNNEAPINFRSASLRAANLNGKLDGSNFEGADLTHATVRGSVKGANFRNTILKNVQFSDYTGIEEQDLTGAVYDCRTFWGSNTRGFDPKSKGARLEGGPCKTVKRGVVTHEQ